jgi:hypothetical protein
MSVPLATLRRHSQLVWLHDPMGLPPAAPPPSRPAIAFNASTPLDVTRGKRRTFWHADEAQDWLRFWKNDAAGVMALRVALQKSEPSAPVYSWSDEQVIAKLAGRLARGAVVVTEAALPAAPSVLPTAPAPPAVAEPPAVPVSQILAAVPVPPPPLLPLLEEVQVEGAEVLPEIEQSLEQVELTIGEIKVAPVSLEPTPSKVPGIESAMTEAGASVTSELDKL